MTDEIMIDRLSAAYDRAMSRNSNGMYDFTDYRERGGKTLDPDQFMAEIDQAPNDTVMSKEEWRKIQETMSDEEKAIMAYEK